MSAPGHFQTSRPRFQARVRSSLNNRHRRIGPKGGCGFWLARPPSPSVCTARGWGFRPPRHQFWAGTVPHVSQNVRRDASHGQCPPAPALSWFSRISDAFGRPSSGFVAKTCSRGLPCDINKRPDAALVAGEAFLKPPLPAFRSENNLTTPQNAS